MEKTLRVFERGVPSPQAMPSLESFAFRYVEKTIHQALVQKLARIVSGLHAARLLMEHGFVQEQAALQRMLDELQEDTTFLCLAVLNGDRTELHEKYLAAFYEEEFDSDSAIDSSQKRPMVSRAKIRAYIARAEAEANPDQGRGIEAARTIHKLYSGYVHAASPQVMEMYFGNPPIFHVRGMQGTLRQHEHRDDLWNYFYRSIIAFGFCAEAFGSRELFDKIHEFTKLFAAQAGKDYVQAR